MESMLKKMGDMAEKASKAFNKKDEQPENFGESRLAEKQDLIEELKGNQMFDADEINEAAGRMLKGFINGSRSAMSAIKKGATPEFVNRILNTKQYKIQMMAAEDVIDESNESIEKTIKDEQKYSHDTRKRLEKLKAASDKRLQGELKQLEILRKDAERKKKAQRDDFQNNRKLQKIEAEKKAGNDKAEQDRIQAEEDEKRRTQLTDYWKEQAIILQKEAVENREKYLQSVQQDYDYTLEALSEEYKDRDLARAKLQVLPASTDSPIKLPNSELGVFGTALDPGDFLAVDGGYQPGLDQEDIHVFDSAPQTDFEDAMFDLNDFTAEYDRDQGLYEALSLDAKYLEDSIARMVEMREMHERDIKQLDNEHQLVVTAQTGPPKRLADKFEISSTHTRKEQRSRLHARCEELQHSIDLAESKKRDKEAQMLSLAQKIAVLGEKLKHFEKDVKNVNMGMGQLPVVVGRNISKIRGNGPTARPKDYFDAVTHQSKLVVAQETEKEANKVHYGRMAVDRDLWLARQSENELSIEVEQTFNSLADIQNRLMENSVKNLKLSLVEALKAFFNSGTKLYPRGMVPSGLLQWWKTRNPKISKGVEVFSGGDAMGGISFDEPSAEVENDMNKSGVCLGEGENKGDCFGIIKLPKLGMWTIVLSVVRVTHDDGLSSEKKESSEHDHDEEEGPDEHDYCNIRLGPSFQSLVLVDRYFNRVNPDTGAVIWDVRYLLRGDKLAYRFEFNSSSTKRDYHLAVCTGFYEEYQMDALEYFPDPDGGSRERVLSSFVKLMRVDERQGKNRLTKLLEELINVEEYDGTSWNSEIINKTPQRYSKEYFLKILKAEILAEMHNAKKSGAVQLDNEFFQENNDEPQHVVAQRERLAASQKAYLDRKQGGQQYLIERGEKIIGKFIELYDEDSDIWIMCYVKDCHVDWIENGVTLKLTHTLEEVNKGGEVLNTLIVDLSTRRYFESAQQEFNEEAVRRWKQARKWKARLKELNDMATDAQTKYKDAFSKIKEDAETKLSEEIDNSYHSFDEKSEQEAIEKFHDPRTEDWINHRIPDIILDMRKGIVERDLEMAPRDQAILIAQEKFIENYKVVKRAALDKMVAVKRERMQLKLAAKLEEFKKAENDYISQLHAEKYNLEWSIKEQWEMERDAALAKLKFKEGEFDKVVPKGALCEHLKTKAWGTKYAIGVRCVHCGKELTELYKEESQIRGYGSGTDPKMWIAINEHRKDEATFRGESAEHLKSVEDERIRLEKERRIMEESEQYFYDFADLKCIYEFDQRHQMSIKKSGKFRQGLQWTEEQLDHYSESKKAAKKRELIKENKQLTLLDEYDPLDEVEQPPPTFRAQDERRKAQFVETIFGIGRLHNFQKKIAGLKNDRLKLLTDIALYNAILTSLHKDSFVFDDDLQDLEKDLDRTAKLLATYDKMQKLWAQAGKIEAQARRDKKKAEMRHCGLWESVKEQIDVTTFLREETRGLLKLRYLYEARYEQLVRQVGDTRTVVVTAREAYIEAELEAQALAYCKPGNYVNTKFGFGTICMYRAKDQMVLILLPWGNPGGKLWIRRDEIVNPERAKQQGERYLMEIEDRTMKKIVKAEQIAIRKELFHMRNEEVGVKEYWAFQDSGKNEQELVTKGTEESIVRTYELCHTKKFASIAKKKGDALVAEKQRANEAAMKAYKGPKSGAPKKLRSKDIVAIRNELTNELKANFLAKELKQSERDVKAQLKKQRFDYFVKYLFDMMIGSFVDESIREIAQEAYVEGRDAKNAAEKMSGLIFPVPKHMQHSSYRLIRDLWKDRKAWLKESIEMRLGAANRAENAKKKSEEVDEEEATRRLEQKRLRKLEKKRQSKLCLEMYEEEIACKEFYRWEMAQNLRERRQMRQSEEETRKYLDEVARLQEMSKSSYHVSDSNLEMEQQQAAATSHDDRREQLKALVIERRKIAFELECMEEEDALSKQLREVDRLERQKAKFDQEYGKVKDDEDAPVVVHEVETNEDGSVVVPKWMVLPDNWFDMNQVMQHEYVYHETKTRECRMNVVKNNERDRRRHEAMQKKGKREWRQMMALLNVKEWRCELEYMEFEETAKESEYRVAELKENLRKLNLFCRQKGEEELRAKSDLRKMEELARRRTRELEEAEAFLQLCIRRSKTRDKLKRRITNDCMFVDTDSITGFHQRFTTYNLRDRLYWLYFKKIVYSIVNRAETIATERKQMKIQEYLSENRAQLMDRTIALKWTWKDIQRDEIMRLRRSALNKQFFPLARKRTLREKFGSWVRFFYWNRGIREAFTMKYSVLRRQADLDRQFKEQLKKQEHKKSPPKHEYKASTIMAKHRERTVQCRNCIQFYLETQNNCFSCAFHPGSYQFSCPRSCKNPGLTMKCVAHKRKRWTCCDSGNENIQGCARRYHIPKDEDPVYSALMKRINQRDKEELDDVDERLGRAIAGDWINKEREIKITQVRSVVEEMDKERAKVTAYDNLKFF